MSHKRGIIAVVGLAMLAYGSLAEAQNQGQRGRGGFGRNRGGIVNLAGAEAVQKEIGIGDQEKAKITSLVEEYGNEVQEQIRTAIGDGGFQNLSSEERQKAVEKMGEISRTVTAKFTPKLKEILSSEQFTRLQQISWQAAGSAALTEEEVIKELSITKEQQEKIAKVTSDYQDKQRELMRSAAGGNFQEIFGKIQELNQERDKLAMDVLTKEQQDKFSKLKGTAFDLTQLRPTGGQRRNNN